MRTRDLDWDGCFNVRDLGGLPAAGGRQTRWGALVRADAVDRLTAAGWSALEAHGVRTVIDLRNVEELAADVAPRPRGVSTLHLPLDGVEDTEFWDRCKHQAPPLYYGSFLGRFPNRVADVMTAIARARPGGVLFHCVGGRDRTGLIAMLVLALVGVAPDDIADDHGRSDDRLAALYALSGEGDQAGVIADFLAREGTTVRDLILSTVASLDVDAYLRAAGVTEDDLAALRNRMLA